MNIKKIKPMFTKIVTTMDRYDKDQKVGNLIDTHKVSGTVKEIQRVVAVGDNSAGIKEGQLVLINPTRYAVMKHEKGSLKNGVITDNPVIGYNLPVIELNGVPHLLIDTQDVDYVILDYEDDVVEETVEEKAAKAGIYTPGNTIIT